MVDVRVQGAAAARRIKWALGQLSQLDLDVVVLARGGGSRADLAAFDTELVARAIAGMPVPVITGVGHETDRSVADEVAYHACKTPTACAQLLIGAGGRVRGRARRRVAAGQRRVPVNAWRSRRASSTTPGDGRGGAHRPRWRGNGRALERAHGRARRAGPPAHR